MISYLLQAKILIFPLGLVVPFLTQEKFNAAIDAVALSAAIYSHSFGAVGPTMPSPAAPQASDSTNTLALGLGIGGGLLALIVIAVAAVLVSQRRAGRYGGVATGEALPDQDHHELLPTGAVMTSPVAATSSAPSPGRP